MPIVRAHADPIAVTSRAAHDGSRGTASGSSGPRESALPAAADGPTPSRPMRGHVATESRGRPRSRPAISGPGSKAWDRPASGRRVDAGPGLLRRTGPPHPDRIPHDGPAPNARRLPHHPLEPGRPRRRPGRVGGPVRRLLISDLRPDPPQGAPARPVPRPRPVLFRPDHREADHLGRRPVPRTLPRVPPGRLHLLPGRRPRPRPGPQAGRRGPGLLDRLR